MTLSPIFFNLVFYLLILCVGIDFLISGLLLQKEYTKQLEKPKLLGLRILKLNQGFFNRMREVSRIYELIYSYQGIKLLMLLAGFLIIAGSLIQVIAIILAK